ncbi:hypothetical protein GGR50DRAFT_643680 [Xylaria sp. CBS 124048]|nr:hypothetical protein GGR50DRAFT_643680 [Xylaria sp. CBS 124048]
MVLCRPVNWLVGLVGFGGLCLEQEMVGKVSRQGRQGGQGRQGIDTAGSSAGCMQSGWIRRAHHVRALGKGTCNTFCTFCTCCNYL